MLAKTFRAKFRKGHIEPAEPVEFPEEADLIVHAEELGAAAREPEPWEGYDPEAAVEAFRETAGALKGIDVDARIAAIYRAREEGTRPLQRP